MTPSDLIIVKQKSSLLPLELKVLVFLHKIVPSLYYRELQCCNIFNFN